MMTTDTNLSRRKLLARIPAVAAAAVPAAATALPGLSTAVPDHLDGQQVHRLAETLALLDKLPDGEARKVLTAITEVLNCGMANHTHDAELTALKPQFDMMFEDWWKREETRKLRPDEYSPRTDEEIDQETDKQYELIDKILGYEPLTRDGLELQCRALIMESYDTWDNRTARFFGTFMLFFGWKLPDMLAVELLTKGQVWDDEEEDEHSDEA